MATSIQHPASVSSPRPQADRAADKPAPAREPLWREVLGECLRSLRRERGEKLSETAARAGVSPQYLSEMERGVKEPSSEMIAAVAGALEVTLVDLTLAVADRVRSAQAVEVRTAQVSAVRSGQVRAAQLRAAQLRAAQLRAVRAAKAGARYNAVCSAAYALAA
ncbi:helix-turn-helix domain-containing protein [Nonomuraea sp. NPDC049309]|uniref:helix-turn-helix domain-containing protein n=1 Tax=Nonomuraea sp. NPDC049309 TaxID=3364350 RepID=UPI00371C4926